MDALAPPGNDDRESARDVLLAWFEELDANPVVAAVVADEMTDVERWFVRVQGEAKDVYSVWFELGQRTLRVESYVLPAPEENRGAFFEQLLRRNHGLRDITFAIGEEEAIYLEGRFDLRHVDDETLDRILGQIYETIERSFTAAVQVGFASRFPAQKEPST